MKYHFIFLTVFIFSKITPCYADNYIPYLNLTNKAEWLYDQGEYLEAKKCFEDAFKLVEKIKFKDIVVYSKILSQQNEQKQIYRLLKKYLKQNGGTIRPISISLKRGDIVLSEKRLRELDKYTMDTTSDQYQSELELTNKFEKLYELDVLVRMKNSWKDSIWWVSENDSSYVSRYQQMLEVDSLNYINLLKLLPKVKNLRFREFYLSRLLIHMDYDRFVSIENQLLEFVKDGILDPWVFARSKDRAYSSKVDCPIFFAYSFHFKNLTCLSLEEIKENRMDIGLSTYYSRPSFSYYISPGEMMKEPLDEFYTSEIENRKE